MEKEEWKVSLDRKLSPDETARLKDELRPLLAKKAEEEYISDVIEYSCSMVSNQKSINYVVGELIGMEFEFLPEAVVETIAQKIQLFLASLSSPDPATAAGDDGGNAQDDEQNVKSRLLSIKSNVKNALTMSGALGASREGGRNKAQQNKNESKGKNKKGNASGADDDKKKDNNNNNNRGRRNNNDEQQQQRHPNDKGSGRRDRHGRAFDRLTEGQEGRRGQDNRRGPRGGRGGRDGPRGGGRGGDEDRRGGREGRHGRDGPRGGGGGRGGGDDRHGGRGARGGDRRVSGNRRDRDEFQEEADYVPAEDPRGADGGGRRGGHGGRGRGGRGFDPNKRQRMEEGRAGGRGEQFYDEYNESYEGGYDDYNYDYYPTPRGGPPRGGGRWGGGRFRGRGFRGGGRFGGRGGRGHFASQGAEGGGNEQEGGGENTQNNEVAEAAAVHPSPIVHANYGGGFRGRGFRGRGRGRSFAGRTHVKNILASKTWVRKKDGEGGDDAQGGQSSEAPQDGGES